MKIDELKQIIRECIKEVIMEEDGFVTHIISESMAAVLKAQQKQIVVESKKPEPMFPIKKNSSLSGPEKQKLNETKKKLLEAVGKDAYNGVDVFAGTKPLSSGGSPDLGASVQGPLAHVDPDDAGVPIGKIFENVQNWGKIALGKRKKKES